VPACLPALPAWPGLAAFLSSSHSSHLVLCCAQYLHFRACAAAASPPRRPASQELPAVRGARRWLDESLGRPSLQAGGGGSGASLAVVGPAACEH